MKPESLYKIFTICCLTMGGVFTVVTWISDTYATQDQFKQVEAKVESVQDSISDVKKLVCLTSIQFAKTQQEKLFIRKACVGE